MSAKTIHQEVSFKANPKKVYDALLDAKAFAAFTGPPATIDAKVGGAISGFGGMITGINVELVSGKRIVQAWRAGNWPEGIHSIVRFELAAAGSGTKLTLDHSGAPDGSEEMLEGGWHKMYWEPLVKHLG
ncbi:MAG: SRPBCC domain-containing protein [Stellaceae bacterium]